MEFGDRSYRVPTLFLPNLLGWAARRIGLVTDDVTTGVPVAVGLALFFLPVDLPGRSRCSAG